MNITPGLLKAELAQPPEDGPSEELVRLVNTNIKPPARLRPEDLYIRAMYVASDQINSFGGRFPVEEMGNLTRLLVDSPVMVGHRKDRLPIGRNFHAVVETRGETTWVKGYFYWLKGSADAERLRENIDGGIYKECSIGFTFGFARCSVCGRDIRSCCHHPLKSYPHTGGRVQTCHFEYRQIDKVLETSLVYRGAQPNTSITKELGPGLSSPFSESMLVGRMDHPFEITCLSQLDFDQRYLVVPCYDSIPVIAHRNEGQVSLALLTGDRLDANLLTPQSLTSIPEVQPRFGWLVGYRGKERCSSTQLERRLNRLSSSVTHVDLRLFPDTGSLGMTGSPGDEHASGADVPHRIVSHDLLPTAVRSLKTRDGVMIWPLSHPAPQFGGFRYRPEATLTEGVGWFRVVFNQDSSEVLLQLSHRGLREDLLIAGLTGDIRSDGAHCLARRIETGSSTDGMNPHTIVTGKIRSVRRWDTAPVLELSGGWPVRINLRPALLNGRQCFLMSCRTTTVNCPDRQH